MMEVKRVEVEAALIPLRMGLGDLGPQGLRARVRGVEGLEQAFNQLVEELQGTVEASTPPKKINRGKVSP